MTVISCEAAQFKKFVETILTIGQESILNFSKDGIRTRFVDVANVGMVDIFYPASAMKGYQFNEKCPVKVGMEWTNVPKLLSAAKPFTPLTVKFTKDRVTFTYAEVTACVKYLDINDIRKEPNTLLITLPAKFAFEGALLTKLKKILTEDKIKLVIKNGVAYAESYGDDENHQKVLLSQCVKGAYVSLYSWEYLSEMEKVLKNTYVTCAYDTKHPIQLEATVNGIEVKYLLAPRIESN